MIDLAHTKLTVHFEVSDADIFGGDGSIGYTSASFEPCSKVLLEKGEGGYNTIVTSLTNTIVEVTQVTPDKLRLISKAEYDENMDDDEDLETEEINLEEFR